MKTENTKKLAGFVWGISLGLSISILYTLFAYKQYNESFVGKNQNHLKRQAIPITSIAGLLPDYEKEFVISNINDITSYDDGQFLNVVFVRKEK